MPLTLLFSSRFNTDKPYTIPTDVVSARDLVVEVVNVGNLARRMAGWLYSVNPTGLGDEEIAEAKRIAFGKNRVRFDVHALPYKLRFYPMYGLKNFDINIYTGRERVDPGTQLNATFIARHESMMRGGIIQYRLSTGATWTNLPGMAAIAQAYYRPGNNVLIVRTHSNEVWYCLVGTWVWIADTIANLRIVVAEPSTRQIHTIATPQV